MQSNNPQVGPIDLDYLFGIDYDATESIVHKEQEGLPHNPDLFIGLFKEQSQTPYSIIKEILSNLNLKKGDVLMDLGSGFGRFILYGGVLYPENKFIGIELSSARANQSIKGKEQLGLDNVQIINNDVLKSDFSSANVFYIFNSFPTIFNKVAHKLKLLHLKGKKFCVVFRFTDLEYIHKNHQWLKPGRLLNKNESIYEYCNH